MSRVKRSVTAKKKRRKIFKLAKGFFGARSRLLRDHNGSREPGSELCVPRQEGAEAGIQETVDCQDQCCFARAGIDLQSAH